MFKGNVNECPGHSLSTQNGDFMKVCAFIALEIEIFTFFKE